MKSTVVSAHNPMTGPRHLGHYVSTMIDWPRLQKDHELFIVIDDLIAAVLYPRGRKEIQKRAFFVAREFVATGVDLEKNHLILTSMIPEVHELALFTALAIDHQWCNKLYGESFAGLLDSYQRRELGLPRHPSVTETLYPQIHLATLTLGLRADLFQGGEEMRGYLGVMEAMVEHLRNDNFPLRAPGLLTTKCTYLVGTDGRHMATENAVYLSETVKELAEAVSRVKSLEVFHQWYSAFNRADLTSQVGQDGPTTNEETRKMTQFLTNEFAKFRDFKVENKDVARILEKSADVCRRRIRETLVSIKRHFGIPGFVE